MKSNRRNPTTCKDCGVELTIRNWYPSFVKHHLYLCNHCDSKRSLKWTREHGRNPIPNKEYGWKRQGIILKFPEFLEILSRQEFKCCICGKRLTPYGTGASADHSHETGKVRGLLCKNCNANLGWYEKYQAVIQQYLLPLRFMVDCTT